MTITLATQPKKSIGNQLALFGKPGVSASAGKTLAEPPLKFSGKDRKDSADPYRKLLFDASCKSDQVKLTSAHKKMLEDFAGSIALRASLLRDSVQALSMTRGELEASKEMLELIPEKPDAWCVAAALNRIMELSGDILKASLQKGWKGRSIFGIRVQAAELHYLTDMWFSLSNGNLIGLLDYYENELPKKDTLAAKNILSDRKIRSIVEIRSGFAAVEALALPSSARSPSGKP